MTYDAANLWVKENKAETTISGSVVSLRAGVAHAAKRVTTPEADLPILVAELQRQLGASA